MREQYIAIKTKEEKDKKLQSLLDKVGDSLVDGRNMSRV